MRIFLTGVACVGKTTIGAILADQLCYRFFDLDTETESFFGASIERLRKQFLTPYSFRIEASKALKHLLARQESINSIIALPPSGLMDSYWKIVKKTGATIMVLHDEPENILKRITFYDIDSRLIERKLSTLEEQLYLKGIRGDISYFRHTYKRAHATVEIAGLNPEEAALKVKEFIMQSPG